MCLGLGNLYAATPGQSPGVARIFRYCTYVYIYIHIYTFIYIYIYIYICGFGVGAFSGPQGYYDQGWLSSFFI